MGGKGDRERKGELVYAHRDDADAPRTRAHAPPPLRCTDCIVRRPEHHHRQHDAMRENVKSMEGAANRRSPLDCTGGGGMQPHSCLWQPRLPLPISCLCVGTSRDADATPIAAVSLLNFTRGQLGQAGRGARAPALLGPAASADVRCERRHHKTDQRCCMVPSLFFQHPLRALSFFFTLLSLMSPSCGAPALLGASAAFL